MQWDWKQLSTLVQRAHRIPSLKGEGEINKVKTFKNVDNLTVMSSLLVTPIYWMLLYVYIMHNSKCCWYRISETRLNIKTVIHKATCLVWLYIISENLALAINKEVPRRWFAGNAWHIRHVWACPLMSFLFDFVLNNDSTLRYFGDVINGILVSCSVCVLFLTARHSLVFYSFAYIRSVRRLRFVPLLTFIKVRSIIRSF